jgi:hypothetical protein
VHGVLLTGFTTDWAALEAEPQKLNFLVAERRDRPLLEADEEVQSLRETILSGDEGQLADAAPWLLAQILNMRGLLRASSGDYAGAREDLEASLAVDPADGEARANLDLLSFWTYHTIEQPHSVLK